MAKLPFTLLLFLSILFNLEAKCVFQKPVEVLETNVGNVISWNTAQEIDNKQFIIQKSTDGKDFSTIGEVNGANNSKLEQKYRFLDISTGERKVFYRIAHVDINGIIGYTPTFIVNRKTDNNFVITAMSSLKTDSYLSVSIRSAIENSLVYKINTLNGKTMISKVLSLVDGANIITIDTSELPNGEYVLQLGMKNEIEEIIFQKVDKKDSTKIDYVVKE
jgi:hypothetical protein